MSKVRYPRYERVDRASDLLDQYMVKELGMDPEDRESVLVAMEQLVIDLMTLRQWWAEETGDETLTPLRWVLPTVVAYQEQDAAYGS